MLDTLRQTGSAFGFVEKAFYYDWSDALGYVAPTSPTDCNSTGFGLLRLDGSCNEIVTQTADVYADWARRSNEIHIQSPTFAQVLDANGWYTFGGSFDTPDGLDASDAELAIDGTWITSYGVTVAGGAWAFTLSPGAWIEALGTTSCAEHVVTLKVQTGGASQTFYTSQVFTVTGL